MKGWDFQKIRQGYTKYVGYFLLGSVILLKSAGNADYQLKYILFTFTC